MSVAFTAMIPKGCTISYYESLIPVQLIIRIHRISKTICSISHQPSNKGIILECRVPKLSQLILQKKCMENILRKFVAGHNY